LNENLGSFTKQAVPKASEEEDLILNKIPVSLQKTERARERDRVRDTEATEAIVKCI
jgi:hypothetical protein